MASKVMELRGIIYSRYKSEAEFARFLGWDKQKLSNITNGRKEPDIGEVVLLANALGRSVGEIIDIFLKNREPNGQHEEHGNENSSQLRG